MDARRSLMLRSIKNYVGCGQTLKFFVSIIFLTASSTLLNDFMSKLRSCRRRKSPKRLRRSRRHCLRWVGYQGTSKIHGICEMLEGRVILDSSTWGDYLFPKGLQT